MLPELPTPYHITFSCYGTWLHGDERGSHDRKATSLRNKHIAPDPALEAQMRRRMTHAVVVLNGPMRRCVREAIVQHCGFREWKLHALSVRTNHVHVVLTTFENVSRVLNQIKGRATRSLREAGLVASDQPVWSARGSKRILDTPEWFESAVRYVTYGQGPELPDE